MEWLIPAVLCELFLLSLQQAVESHPSVYSSTTDDGILVRVKPSAFEFVQRGDRVTMKCKVPYAITNCWLMRPLMNSYADVGPAWSQDPLLRYPSEASMERGECGFTVDSVDNSMHGVTLCAMRIKHSGKDVQGNMTLFIHDNNEFNVTVTPSNAILALGQSLTMLCQVNSEVTGCWMKLPSREVQWLHPSQDSYQGLRYPTEASMERGECGFTADSVNYDMDGIILCLMWTKPSGKYVWGNMTLAVRDNNKLDVTVTPSNATVVVNNRFTMICKVNSKISECWVQLPSRGMQRLYPSFSIDQRLRYPREASTERGECGFTAASVDYDMDGIILCRMRIEPSGNMVLGNMTLAVHGVSSPRIILNGSGTENATYTEGQTINATCIVDKAHPPPRLSWLVNKKTVTEGLEGPRIYQVTGSIAKSISLSFVRTVNDMDNGHNLSCVMLPDYPLEPVNRYRQLVVTYPPKRVGGILKYEDIAEGHTLTVSVLIKANPAPKFTWSVGKIIIIQGQSQDRFRAKTPVELPGKVPGRWQANLTINGVTKEDAQQGCLLIAENAVGMEKFEITLKMRAAPEGNMVSTLFYGTTEIPETAPVSVRVIPNSILNEGSNFTLLCEIGEPIDHCSVRLPWETNPGVFGPGKPPYNNLKYPTNASWDLGQCGFTGAAVGHKFNGRYECNVSPKKGNKMQFGSVNLVVTKDPKMVELLVEPGSLDKSGSHREGETLNAHCTIHDVYPAWNISWYIGEEEIKSDISAVEIWTSPGPITIRGQLRRKLTARDDGQTLRCFAFCPILARNRTKMKTINVLYVPKCDNDSAEHYELVEGTSKTLKSVVNANPKPRFAWHLGSLKIDEGSTEKKANFMVEAAVQVRGKGSGRWESILRIHNVSSEDLNRSYVVTAVNDLGAVTCDVHVLAKPQGNTNGDNGENNLLEDTNRKPLNDGGSNDQGIGAVMITFYVIILLTLLLLISALLFIGFTGRMDNLFGKLGIGKAAVTESVPNRRTRMNLISSLFRRRPNERASFTSTDGGQAKYKAADDAVVYAEVSIKKGRGSSTKRALAVSQKTEYAQIIGTLPS